MALTVGAPVTARKSERGRIRRLCLYVYVGGVFLFLMLPLFIVFPISFSSADYLAFPPPGFSWRWYMSYLNDPTWIDATVRSIEVALTTMIFATVLGTMLAFGVVRGRFYGRVLVGQLALAPIVIPNIVYSVGAYGFFSKLHMIGEWESIAIAHTAYAIPFVVIVVGAALRTFDESQELAAMGLGASRLTAIITVTLPQIRPAVVAAALMSFIQSFDELVIAMFLGGVNVTLPKKMFDNILYEIDPTIAAVSVLQILFVCVALLLAVKFGVGAHPSGTSSIPTPPRQKSADRKRNQEM